MRATALAWRRGWNSELEISAVALTVVVILFGRGGGIGRKRGRGGRAYRIDVDERHARKAAHQRDEFIQIARPDPGDHGAEHDEHEAEDVLLPLDPAVVLAAAGEELVLHDADGGEELQGRAEEDGQAVEELHGVDEPVVLGQVEDDDRLGGGAVRGVGERAHGGEEDGDDDHDEGEDEGEPPRLLHRFLDGDDETHAFEGEDGGADEERPGRRVEGGDVGDAALLHDRGHVVVVQVDQAEHDEDVCDEGGEPELADVADQAQRKEYDQLHEHHPLYVDVRFALGYGKNEGL